LLKNVRQNETNSVLANRIVNDLIEKELVQNLSKVEKAKLVDKVLDATKGRRQLKGRRLFLMTTSLFIGIVAAASATLAGSAAAIIHKEKKDRCKVSGELLEMVEGRKPGYVFSKDDHFYYYPKVKKVKRGPKLSIYCDKGYVNVSRFEVTGFQCWKNNEIIDFLPKCVPESKKSSR
jgi:hypothetical protein